MKDSELSFRSDFRNQTSRQHLADESESAASLYIDYLDSYKRNQSSFALRQVERSDSNFLDRSVADDANPNLDINMEEIKNNVSYQNDFDSELHEAKKDLSQILNRNLLIENEGNFSQIAHQVILEEEHDFSLGSDPKILNLLDDDKSESSFIRLSPFGDTSLSEQDISFSRKFLRLRQAGPQTSTGRPKPKRSRTRPKAPSLNSSALVQSSNSGNSSFALRLTQTGGLGSTFRIGREGLFDSAKNTTSSDVIIGRQPDAPFVMPTDIPLPGPEVSRLHCRIIYKYLYSQLGRIPKKLRYFILQCRRKGVPPFIPYTVLKYLRPTKGVYLQDLGSRHGTFIRLRPFSNTGLRAGLRLQLASQATLQVLYIHERPKQKIASILSTIPREECQLIGFEETQDIVQQLAGQKFLVLQILSATSQKRFAFFLADEENVYLIGRGVKSDLQINLSDISRKHCELFYRAGEWLVRDGSAEVASNNGTWLALPRKRRDHRRSEKRLLLPDDQFKVGDHIFQLII